MTLSYILAFESFFCIWELGRGDMGDPVAVPKFSAWGIFLTYPYRHWILRVDLLREETKVYLINSNMHRCACGQYSRGRKEQKRTRFFYYFLQLGMTF